MTRDEALELLGRDHCACVASYGRVFGMSPRGIVEFVQRDTASLPKWEIVGDRICTMPIAGYTRVLNPEWCEPASVAKARWAKERSDSISERWDLLGRL